MGCGSGVTCWRRLRDWQAAGVWDRLHRELLRQLRDADRIDWSRACMDSSSIAAKKRLSYLSSVVSTLHGLAGTASPQGWRVAPPPSAASALTRHGPCQPGLWSPRRHRLRASP
jgi:hypothetical protein